MLTVPNSDWGDAGFGSPAIFSLTLLKGLIPKPPVLELPDNAGPKAWEGL